MQWVPLLDLLAGICHSCETSFAPVSSNHLNICSRISRENAVLLVPCFELWILTKQVQRPEHVLQYPLTSVFLRKNILKLYPRISLQNRDETCPCVRQSAVGSVSVPGTRNQVITTNTLINWALQSISSWKNKNYQMFEEHSLLSGETLFWLGWWLNTPLVYMTFLMRLLWVTIFFPLSSVRSSLFEV